MSNMMAVHGLKWWDVKWVAGRVLIIVFLLLVSASLTSPQQDIDQRTTSASNNETKGVDAYHRAKVFYKHTWPVRMFTSPKLMLFS